MQLLLFFPEYYQILFAFFHFYRTKRVERSTMGMRDMNGILEKIEQDVENSNPRPLAGHGQEEPVQLLGSCLSVFGQVLVIYKHMS